MKPIILALIQTLAIALTTTAADAPLEMDFALPGGKPMPMVRIEAGSFLMGNTGHEKPSEPWPDELPLHSVKLSAYWIGKYEVTRGEYRRFIAAGGYRHR